MAFFNNPPVGQFNISSFRFNTTNNANNNRSFLFDDHPNANNNTTDNNTNTSNPPAPKRDVPNWINTNTSNPSAPTRDVRNWIKVNKFIHDSTEDMKKCYILQLINTNDIVTSMDEILLPLTDALSKQKYSNKLTSMYNLIKQEKIEYQNKQKSKSKTENNNIKQNVKLFESLPNECIAHIS
eukprot:309420_1